VCVSARPLSHQAVGMSDMRLLQPPDNRLMSPVRLSHSLVSDVLSLPFYDFFSVAIAMADFDDIF